MCIFQLCAYPCKFYFRHSKWQRQCKWDNMLRSQWASELWMYLELMMHLSTDKQNTRFDIFQRMHSYYMLCILMLYYSIIALCMLAPFCIHFSTPITQSSRQDLSKWRCLRPRRKYFNLRICLPLGNCHCFCSRYQGRDLCIRYSSQ